jgi:hypothetical protein
LGGERLATTKEDSTSARAHVTFTAASLGRLRRFRLTEAHLFSVSAKWVLNELGVAHDLTSDWLDHAKVVLKSIVERSLLSFACVELSRKVDKATWALAFLTEFSTFTCTSLLTFVLTAFFKTFLVKMLFSFLPSAHAKQCLQVRVLVEVTVSLSVSDDGRNLSVSALVLANFIEMTAGKGSLLVLSRGMVGLEKSRQVWIPLNVSIGFLII